MSDNYYLLDGTIRGEGSRTRTALQRMEARHEERLRALSFEVATLLTEVRELTIMVTEIHQRTGAGDG